MSTAPVVKSPVPVASQGITCSMFAGAEVEKVFPEKQFASAASLNTTPRSTMPEPSTTLSVTRLPFGWCGASSRPTLGASATPTLLLSAIRFFVMTSSCPPAITTPTPNAGS